MFEEILNYQPTIGLVVQNDGGFIGTIGEGITNDIVRKYSEKHGPLQLKEDKYTQKKLLDY